MKILSLDNLTPADNSNKNKKRKGRGAASGKGRTSTRGRGGSGHRSGNRGKVGFEGGQMPLIRRLPKRGFNNKKFAVVIDIVNLSDLQDRFKSGETVTPEKLKEKGLVSGKFSVKILAKGTINKKIKISGCKFSDAAALKIKEAGGEIV